VKTRVCLAAVLVLVVSTGSIRSQPWRSSLADERGVLIEKTVPADVPDAETVAEGGAMTGVDRLPEDIRTQLGDWAVDYEAFTVTYLPEAATLHLEAGLKARGLQFSLGEPNRVMLPWHHFDLREPSERISTAMSDQLTVAPVSGLYLLQWGYPLKLEWQDQLAGCGIQSIAFFQPSTLLVRASSLEAIQGCSVAPYLWGVEPFYNSDRISEDLAASMTSAGEYWFEFIQGTDLQEKAASLAKDVVVLDVYEPTDGGPGYLRLAGSRQSLLQVVESDVDLLSVSPAGVGETSGERQGQIIAGNRSGNQVTTPGYRSWLSYRGLLNSSNTQTVAVIDMGYDDGQNPGSHHPDLENPERLVGLDGFFTNPSDVVGHGTMVSGIIAGDGTTGTGLVDAAGFSYGLGISPRSSLYAAEVSPLENLNRQSLALTQANLAGAKVVNQSWNLRDTSVSLQYVPVNDYGPVARYFDDRVLDMDVSSSGLQPSTFVFAAGNYRQNCNYWNFDSVASPATAKNVIAVGATRSYLPSPNPPLDCRGCEVDPNTGQTTNFGRPPDENADNVNRVADFSGRGGYFRRYPDASSRYAHLTRIKPDLVAPGVRVYSTVPYAYSLYPDPTPVGCTTFFPSGTYYTYGTGTSFAAPVVSGAAALARQWMLDRGTDPSPSLVKAALIATADTLGGSSGPHDNRPSPLYGWGRVNLDRLTDSASKFYRTDNAGLAVSTGQSRSWTRTISNGSNGTYIVLVWSDASTPVDGNSQVPLVNDLTLKVNSGVWRGNFFNENLTGVDDGYSYEFTVGTGGYDAINTVEAVFIPPGRYSSGQSITITVVGQNVSTASAQKFAVFAYNVTP